VFDASSSVGTWQLMVVICTPGVGGRLPTLINRSIPSRDASAAFNRREYCFVPPNRERKRNMVKYLSFVAVGAPWRDTN
jgi:hypothetical protein